MGGDIPPQQQPILPVATVSVLDVFARVVEIQVKLAEINEKMNDLPDHEARLRVLETAKSKLYGAAAVIGALAGGGAAWVALAVSHR